MWDTPHSYCGGMRLLFHSNEMSRSQWSPQYVPAGPQATWMYNPGPQCPDPGPLRCSGMAPTKEQITESDFKAYLVNEKSGLKTFNENKTYFINAKKQCCNKFPDYLLKKSTNTRKKKLQNVFLFENIYFLSLQQYTQHTGHEVNMWLRAKIYDWVLRFFTEVKALIPRCKKYSTASKCPAFKTVKVYKYYQQNVLKV